MAPEAVEVDDSCMDIPPASPVAVAAPAPGDELQAVDDAMMVSPAPATLNVAALPNAVALAVNIEAAPPPAGEEDDISPLSPMRSMGNLMAAAATPVAQLPPATDDTAATAAAPGDVVLHSCSGGGTPQQPLEEFSFDTVRSASVVASPEATEPAAAAVEGGDALQAADAMMCSPIAAARPAPKTPKVTPAAASARPLTASKAGFGSTTPARIGADAIAKRTPLPASASTKKAAAEPTPQPVRTPSTRAASTRTPAVTPAAATRPASSLRSSKAAAAAAPAPAATPVAAAAAEKRVSICSPMPASAGGGSTHFSRPAASTPYPKSAKGTPAAASPAEAMGLHSESATPLAVAAAAATPLTAAAPAAAASDEDMDTAMLLAAALPPSVRTTAEEAPAAAYEMVAEAVPLVPAEAVEDGMDVDMDAPELEACVVEVAATAAAATTPMAAAATIAKIAQFEPVCNVYRQECPPAMFSVYFTGCRSRGHPLENTLTLFFSCPLPTGL